MKKNYLLIIVFMCLVSHNTFAHDIEVANSDGVSIYYVWNADKTSLVVSYRGEKYYTYDNEYSGNIVIPETVTYDGKVYDVTSIGEFSFYSCQNLTSVVIPNSVESIGGAAFAECINLSTITIPTNVNAIGSMAFQNCHSLLDISIPDKVKIIENSVFKGCSGITSITIPDSVTSIRSSAFYGCSGLSSISVPENVTSIGSSAFRKCKNIISANIGKKVETISDGLFGECEKLSTFTIPNSVVKIINNAFNGCISLKSIVIGSGVNSIASTSFGNTNINKIIWLPQTPPKGYDAVLGNINYVSNTDYSSLSNTVICPLLSSYFEKDSIGYVPISSIDNGCEIINNFSTKESLEINRNVSFEEKELLVSSIGDYAFYDCSGLNLINIPNSITSIGKYAFYNCGSLTSIIFSPNITSLGDYAFKGCNINEVKVSVTDLSAFCNNKVMKQIRNILNIPVTLVDEGGNEIKEYVIPNDVASIGNSAFENCTGLSSVTIPNSVTLIGSYAFSGCDSLTSIVFSPNITSLGDYAFKGCNINEVKVSVTDLSAFCNNKVMKQIRNNLNIPVTLVDECGNEIKEYVIPNDVTSIGNSTFDNCMGLTSVTIPNSVNAIGVDSFRDCVGLASMTIPKNISSIDYSAFFGCNNLSSVTIHSETIGSWFCGLSSINKVTIGDEVTTIGSNAFKDCSGLVSIVIPNNVTSIGYEAFKNCNKLLSLTIGTGVTSIGQNAFGNTNLKKTIWLTNTPPSGYKYASGAVNYVANEQYSNLKNIIIYPFISSLFEVDGIYYVPVSPSERTCDAIDCKYDVTMVSTNISSEVSYKGISMSVLKVQPYLCYNNKYIEELTCNNNGDIADYAFAVCTNIKSIACNNCGIVGDNAFVSCSNAKSLSLGKNITSIGKYSFKDCSLLQTVTIPDSVTLLDDYAFSGCSSLKIILIGNHMNTIGKGAFENCKLIQSIIIPDSVKTINNYAFSGCKGLKTLVIADRDSELSLGKNGSSPLFADCLLDSVYIGGNITYDASSNSGYSPFYRNLSLRTVVITNKETEISPNEFYGCTNLQNFSIGDGVTLVGDWAFSGCQSLKTFEFGSKVKTIGKEAFSDCTAMEKIVSKAQNPPVCGIQALDDINKWDCKLYVPEGCLSAYQTEDQWKEFFYIEETSNPIDSRVNQVPNQSFVIVNEGGMIMVYGLEEDTKISVYAINGAQAGGAISKNGVATILTSMQSRSMVMLKIGHEAIKYILK